MNIEINNIFVDKARLWLSR